MMITFNKIAKDVRKKLDLVIQSLFFSMIEGLGFGIGILIAIFILFQSHG